MYIKFGEIFCLFHQTNRQIVTIHVIAYKFKTLSFVCSPLKEKAVPTQTRHNVTCVHLFFYSYYFLCSTIAIHNSYYSKYLLLF